MTVWKDTTGYSQHKERIPKTWTLHLGDFFITVTCGHIYYKGKWIVRCEPFFDTVELLVETKEEAQAKALQMVAQKLEAAISALKTAQGEK